MKDLEGLQLRILKALKKAWQQSAGGSKSNERLVVCHGSACHRTPCGSKSPSPPASSYDSSPASPPPFPLFLPSLDDDHHKENRGGSPAGIRTQVSGGLLTACRPAAMIQNPESMAPVGLTNWFGR